MSDVINSIFGRPKNETPGSGEYGYEPVATEPVAVAVAEEPAEPAGDTDTAVEGEETDSSPEVAAATETAEDDSIDGDEDEDGTEDSTETVEAETAEDDSAEDEDADEESTEDTGEAVAEEDTDGDDDADQELAAVVTEEAEEVPAEETDETSARPAAATRGATTVADAVVTKVVTGVARKTEGVHDLAGDLTIVVDGEVASISMPLVIEFGHAVKPLAERIRVDVIDAVERLLGLEVDNLDVHIADIHLGD